MDKFYIYRSRGPRERSGDFGTLESGRVAQQLKASTLRAARRDSARVVEFPARGNAVTKIGEPPKASNA